jgi:hypothetical protein
MNYITAIRGRHLSRTDVPRGGRSPGCSGHQMSCSGAISSVLTIDRVHQLWSGRRQRGACERPPESISYIYFFLCSRRNALRPNRPVKLLKIRGHPSRRAGDPALRKKLKSVVIRPAHGGESPSRRPSRSIAMLARKPRSQFSSLSDRRRPQSGGRTVASRFSHTRRFKCRERE